MDKTGYRATFITMLLFLAKSWLEGVNSRWDECSVDECYKDDGSATFV